VKALGLEVDGQAQVSMNLVDIERTPLSVAFEAVRKEALAHGVQVTWSEIIGLLPEKVLCEAAGRYLRLRQPVEDHLLEHRMLEARSTNHTLSGYLDLVGSGDPAPGGGSVAAYVGALAAALARMAANLTLNRDKYVQVHREMLAVQLETHRIATRLNELAAQDAKAYEGVMEAYALPHRTDEETSTRRWTVQDALLAAVGIPLEVARLCVRIAELSMVTAERGNTNAITDAGTAAVMAEAACKAASFNVRINVKALGNVEGVQDLARDADGCVVATSAHAAEVVALVEHALSDD
jgi:glutamate formiminotransferase/formiminotetrahydrofolate cyclodeaminase